MSLSCQITVGWADRHVRCSEVMSGPVDMVSLGCIKQSGWATGHDEPVSADGGAADACQKAPLSGIIFISRLLCGV